jgi:uncharacterized protein YutE (UPF0331/DUF86 family)
MVDEDVVLAKVANIQRCLGRVREKVGDDLARLDNVDLQDIVVLNVQRAIQSAIDLAAHVVASEGLGLPDTIRANFELLEKRGIIDSEVAGAMSRMCGFRNIAVHDYATLDREILKAIVRDRLGDLEAFCGRVLGAFAIARGS